MRISLLNIVDFNKIKIKLNGNKKKIDIYYHISNVKYNSDYIKKKFIEKNFIVNQCNALVINNINQKKFSKEYITFLYNFSKIKILTKSLKEHFSFKNEISLWWLTKLSQRKKSKTKIPRYMELLFLLKELTNLFSKKKNKKEIFIIFDDREYVSLTKEALSNNLKGKFDLIIKEYVAHDKNIQNIKKLINSIKKKINLPVILKNWLSLIKLFFFLKKIYNPYNKDKDKTLLFVDTEDLSVINNKIHNRYFPNLKKEFLKRGLAFNTIYVNKDKIINKIEDKLKYKEKINYLNHYQHLYPGVKDFLSLFFSSIKWLIFTRLLFLSKNFKEASKYFNTSLQRYILQEFHILAQIDGPILIFNFLCWKNLIKKLQPRAVIYRKEFNSFGRIISAAACKNTLMIGVQHGIVNDDQYGYKYKKEEIDNNSAVASNFVKYCPCPDIVAVFGKRMEEFMTSYGFPKNKISLIGSLKYDGILKKYTYPSINFRIKQKILKCYHIPKKFKIITLICQWPQVSANHLKMIIQSSKYYAYEAFVIIKPHPLMKEKTIRSINLILKKFKFNNYKFIEDKIEKVLYISDVTIIHSSTAGLDSLVLGTPVILLGGGLYNNSIYKNSPAFYKAHNSKDLGILFSKIFDTNFDKKNWNNSRVRFLNHHLMNLKINAHDKLAKLIQKK
jgi:surface carbohydrate biosynthesis protein (TIGR04326 family)